MDLSDFIQPLIIEKAEDFNPRQAKARFENMCKMLSMQAFWLCIFEYLEKHQAVISGVKFTQGSYSSGVTGMMEAVPIEGADEKKTAAALNASKAVFSKARGKIARLDTYLLRSIASQALANGGALEPGRLATLGNKQETLRRALGDDLHGLRMSIIESKELDAATSASVASALAGRPARRL